MIYIDTTKLGDKPHYPILRRYESLCGAGCTYLLKIYKYSNSSPILSLNLQDVAPSDRYNLFLVEKELLNSLEGGHYTVKVYAIINDEEVFIDEDIFYVYINRVVNKEKEDIPYQSETDRIYK